MMPNAIDPRDEFEKVFPLPAHVIRCGKGYACTEYNAWGGHDFIRKWEGWSAAMLHGSEPVSNRDELNSPVIPDGWVMVPVEPTEDMIVYGFESEPDEDFSEPAVWEEYQAMSGCRQAAHRAKLCWAAMIAAAPKLGG